jgi:preprotein translocase subunit SecF
VGNSTSTALSVAQNAYSNALNNRENAIINAIQSVAPIHSYSVNTVGATLSALFLTQARNILIYAFILSAIVIFLIFRSLTPSSIVIIGAVSDILITLGGMSLFSIPLTLDSIAALLMLIGFSLDTDVLLTIKILKREEGTIYERAFDAMKTGFMMNITTIGAFFVLFIVGMVFQISAYYEIGAVACMGGLADFAATWGLNAVMVLNHAEKVKKT